MNPKDRFAELEKKVQLIAERLKSAQQKQAEHLNEIERLRLESHELDREIKSLKKEREQVKNKIERILNAISRVSSE